MKPNFALSLSFDGIRLLHRAAGGWRVVGEVALDADDMGSELGVLRRTATSLEPGGVRTKLLVPNEQIKYLTIDTPGMDDNARRVAAKRALDGATPYPVDDLAFDISVDSNRTHVAAVARETLAEAEAFANEHRFHPVSFAAIPADQPYLGEPFFGPTESADALLDEGDRVEPDGIAVVVIGDVEIPQQVEKEDTPEPDVDGPIEVEDSKPEPATDHDAALKDSAGQGVSESEAKQKKMPDAVSKRGSAKRELSKAKKTQPETTEPEPDTVTIPAPLEDANQGAAPKDAAPVPSGPAVEAPKTATPIATEKPDKKTIPQTKPDITTPKAAPALGAASRHSPNFSTANPNVPVASPTPAEMPSSAPAAGFASRRAPEIPNLPDSKPGARREPSLGGPRLNGAAGTTIAATGMSVSDPSVPGAGGAIKPDSSSLAPQIPEATAPPKTGFLSRRKAKAVPKTALPRAAAPAAITASSEAERMTVFGARREDVRGKPRFLGLILTAALLIFLAGVAAWASVFLDDGISLSRLFGDRSPRVTASIPDPPKEELEGIQKASLDPGLTEEDSAVLDALRDPVEPPVQIVTEAEAAAKYAATGIWPLAPDAPPEPAALIDIEDLYVTSIDPISTSNDAVALPSTDNYFTDAVFGSVPSPAAAGTQFAYDARGLIIPTAQGALSPDGFTVFLGRPDIVPVGLPDRSTQVVVVEPETENPLAKSRPRLRPGDLVETAERAQLDGLSKSELAEFRPTLRPASIQQKSAAAAEVAVPEEPTVDTSAAVAAALAEAPAPKPTIENATKFAVRASLRPDTRPQNFARIVKRAQRTAPQETQVASAAAVAPKVVTPKIPTKTSVARQATVKNAINLHKVNLIGVYGKPSSRRALVRLGNGRYKKVVVGDRIDGGRVSAIGDSELRYTKRGRAVVLKMPKG